MQAAWDQVSIRERRRHEQPRESGREKLAHAAQKRPVVHAPANEAIRRRAQVRLDLNQRPIQLPCGRVDRARHGGSHRNVVVRRVEPVHVDEPVDFAAAADSRVEAVDAGAEERRGAAVAAGFRCPAPGVELYRLERLTPRGEDLLSGGQRVEQRGRHRLGPPERAARIAIGIAAISNGS
jgi:hypothetical protein